MSTEFYSFEQVLEKFGLEDAELRNAVAAGVVKPVVEHEARFLALLVLKPEGLEALRGLAADLIEVRVNFAGAVQGGRVLFVPADRTLGRLMGEVVADARTIAEVARKAGIVPGQPLPLNLTVPRAPAWQTRPVLPPDGARELEAEGVALVERLAAEASIRILVERQPVWKFRKSDLDQLSKGQMTQPTLILPVARPSDTAAGLDSFDEDDEEELPDFEDGVDLAETDTGDRLRPAPPSKAVAPRKDAEAGPPPEKKRETTGMPRPGATPARDKDKGPFPTTTETFGGTTPPSRPSNVRAAPSAPGAGPPAAAAAPPPAPPKAAPPPPPAPAPAKPSSPTPSEVAALPPMPASRTGAGLARRSRSVGSSEQAPSGMTTEPLDLRDDSSGEAGAALEDSGLRRTTVRFYSQMYPFECFPLVVVLSEKRIRKIQMKDVAQVEGTERIAVTAEEPLVEIVPHFPGCHVVPERIVLDVTPRQAEARFYVTPMVEGTIPEASVLIVRGRKTLDRVATPCRVTKQTFAKMTLGLSVASPVVSTVFESFDFSVRDELPTMVVWLGRFVDAIGGPSVAGFLVFVALLAVAGVLYRRNRPRQASPVVDFLDVEAVGVPKKPAASPPAGGRWS